MSFYVINQNLIVLFILYHLLEVEHLIQKNIYSKMLYQEQNRN